MTTDPSPRGRAAALFARPLAALLALVVAASVAAPAFAADPAPGGTPRKGGGEANLVLPNLAQDKLFLNNSVSGQTLLYSGLVVSVIGLGFGLMVYSQLKNM